MHRLFRTWTMGLTAVLGVMALAAPAAAQPAPTPVPEPATLALVVLAAGGIALTRRRK